jgi:hypothetical protein
VNRDNDRREITIVYARGSSLRLKRNKADGSGASLARAKAAFCLKIEDFADERYYD